MKPRYERGYLTAQLPEEVFVGYIEEFDMYIDWAEWSVHPITLVGDYTDRGYNYDGFTVVDGVITQDPYKALHVTPYHMCLVYAKAIEHGLIKETADAAEV